MVARSINTIECHPKCFVTSCMLHPLAASLSYTLGIAMPTPGCHDACRRWHASASDWLQCVSATASPRNAVTSQTQGNLGPRIRTINSVVGCPGDGACVYLPWSLPEAQDTYQQRRKNVTTSHRQAEHMSHMDSGVRVYPETSRRSRHPQSSARASRPNSCPS